MESSNISKKNGGIVEKSYIPNLEKMALENINFSHNEKITIPSEYFDSSSGEVYIHIVSFFYNIDEGYAFMSEVVTISFEYTLKSNTVILS